MADEIKLKIVDRGSQREVTFSGIAKAVKKIGQGTAEEIFAIMEAGAIEMRNEMIKGIMHSPPTGRTYKYKGKDYTASSPGNPPRSRSGNLVASIVTSAEKVYGGYKVSVGSNITNPPYPRFLEKGTSRMKPRPWLGPVADEQVPKIYKSITDLIALKLKGFKA